jgi:type II secretory pathway pseudopilin PulG
VRGSNGFALLDVIFVCGIMGLLMSIAVPKVLLARQAASAASAIGSLRAISSGQLTFALTCGSGFYAPSLTTLAMAPSGSGQGFISAELGAADVIQHSSYTFRLEGLPYAGAPPSCNGLLSGETAEGFRSAADPTEPSNLRFFGLNSGAQIYEAAVSLYDDMPEAGEPPIGEVLQ